MYATILLYYIVWQEVWLLIVLWSGEGWAIFFSFQLNFVSHLSFEFCSIFPSFVTLSLLYLFFHTISISSILSLYRPPLSFWLKLSFSFILPLLHYLILSSFSAFLLSRFLSLFLFLSLSFSLSWYVLIFTKQFFSFSISSISHQFLSLSL